MHRVWRLSAPATILRKCWWVLLSVPASGETPYARAFPMQDVICFQDRCRVENSILIRTEPGYEYYVWSLSVNRACRALVQLHVPCSRPFPQQRWIVLYVRSLLSPQYSLIYLRFRNFLRCDIGHFHGTRRTTPRHAPTFKHVIVRAGLVTSELHCFRQVCSLLSS